MKKLKKTYKEYRFADVTSMLTTLMTNEFSSYYLDYTKDICILKRKNDVKRRQVQTVLYHALNVLVRLWAPILVHTCEEVNDFFHAEDESIHLGSFLESIDVEENEELKLRWKNYGST